MGKKKKKKAKAERERMLAAYRPTSGFRETCLTYRAIPVDPGEPTGTFISGGGVTIKLNPNATWEESTAEVCSFTDQVIAKLIADAIRAIR